MRQSGKTRSEAALRLAVVEYSRICYERGLISANDGNLSVRLDEANILITPAGISKGRMRPDQLVVVAKHGSPASSGALLGPSTETPMHLEVYRLRADVCAIIHAHPVFATALTVAGLDFPIDILPEGVLLLGEVPVTGYATPSSPEDAEAVRSLFPKHNAILLRQHGSLTFGVDLEQALVNLERLEHIAEVFWRAHSLGRVERLTPKARRALEERRRSSRAE